MKNLLLFIIFLYNCNCFSQCEYVLLTTQKEVDDYPKRYRNCKKIRFIEVTDRKGRISNLDSLKYVEELQTLIFLDSMNTIKDISGLYNIKKGFEFIINTHNNYLPFENLDTIVGIGIRIFNPIKIQDSITLRLYANVRYIHKAIVLDSNIILRGLGKFTSGEVLQIGIQNNYLNNTMDNVVPYSGQEKLHLGFRNVKNLSTKGIERVKKIDRLFLWNTSHCDFKELYNIPQIDTLIMINQRDTLDYQHGFVNVTSLKRLELDTIEVGGDLVPLLPALEYVEEYISITNSSNIRNLDFLSRLRVSIPPPIKNPDPYLVIRNNPNLISCVNPFICKLLRTQPDHVILENNGAGCDRATILASCLSATDNINHKGVYYAYPNPFHQELSIPSSDHLSLMAIYNTAGQRMKLDYLDKDRLDTSAWPNGIYIVQYSYDNKLNYQKVVKQ